MSITKFKKALVLFKMRIGLPITITKTYIVPLFNLEFSKSFAEVPSNIHDIADRGWNSLNWALLFNTEVPKKNIAEINDDNTVTAAPRNIFTGDQSVISLMTSTKQCCLNLLRDTQQGFPNAQFDIWVDGYNNHWSSLVCHEGGRCKRKY